MKNANDVLAWAATLPDDTLLTRINELTRSERCVTAELIAHLAELDERPAVSAARGYPSLFAYCTDALRLSEDATYNRLEAARAARRFPTILGLLAEGAVSLTAIRMLARHLTPENHAAVLAEARGKSKRDVEVLVARLAPRPDVVSSVRRLPSRVADRSPAEAAPLPFEDAQRTAGGVGWGAIRWWVPRALRMRRRPSMRASRGTRRALSPRPRGRRSRPSSPQRRRVIACSSPSARRPTTSCAGSRTSWPARSPAAIRPSSSIGPSACCSRGWRRRRVSLGQRQPLVPERVSGRLRSITLAHPVTSPLRSDEQ